MNEDIDYAWKDDKGESGKEWNNKTYSVWQWF